VPAVIGLLPASTSAFATRDASVPTRSSPTCGAFYATRQLGGGIGGSAHVNLGWCADGEHVRVTWGPDCPVDETGLMHIDATCQVQRQGGGGIGIDLVANARPSTSTMLFDSVGTGWVLLPNGRLVEPSD
jgi:hypothetical protein